MDYRIFTALVLWTMAILFRFGELRFLLLRYAAFQRFIRDRPLRLDEYGLSRFFSYYFFYAGICVLFFNYALENTYLWTNFLVAVLYFVAIFSGIIYINITTRYLIFIDDEDQKEEKEEKVAV